MVLLPCLKPAVELGSLPKRDGRQMTPAVAAVTISIFWLSRRDKKTRPFLLGRAQRIGGIFHDTDEYAE